MLGSKTSVKGFHQLGQVGLVVAMSVCLSLCLMSLPDVFLGLSLALISHDQFQASHRSTPLPLPPPPRPRVSLLLSASVERVGVSCMQDFVLFRWFMFLFLKVHLKKKKDPILQASVLFYYKRGQQIILYDIV